MGMDFGSILDEWEKRQRGHYSSSDRLEELIDQYAPTTEDLPAEEEAEGNASSDESMPSVRTWPIESELDLHGFTVAQAERMLDRFLHESFSRGLKKVLIIHGKGNHSTKGGKLKNAVLRFLEQHPLAGARGVPDRQRGGSGAVWVRVRHRSR